MSGKGHNSPIVADRLKSFVERIERLIGEREALQADIKDIYSEVKGVGYDVKTLRKVIQLRAMDAADRAEQEALLDTYLHALGMVDRIEARAAAGESVREIAKAEGVSKSTAHRVSQKRATVENGTPHNPETGEITETPGAVPAGDGTGTAVTSSPAPAVAITDEAATDAMMAAHEHMQSLMAARRVA